MKVNKKQLITCNKCNEKFKAQKEMDRDGFFGQPIARVHEFSTCPHCQQTDHHWLHSNDCRMPEFEGNFDTKRKAKRQWLMNN